MPRRFVPRRRRPALNPPCSATVRASLFMLFNTALGSYIVGTITLLVVSASLSFSAPPHVAAADIAAALSALPPPASYAVGAAAATHPFACFHDCR